MSYSVTLGEGKFSKAFGKELHCSPKHSQNISRAIKGMKISEAEQLLEKICEKREPLPFRTHLGKMSHRKGGFGPGAYPVKAASMIAGVLKNVKSNAESSGLDPENSVIIHCSAYKGRPIPGTKPRAHGRATKWDKQRTNIELVVKELEG
ncbi:MAG TPA: 50S ribosomal protein L22 [Thermoplasmata archaeon]|nr:50S ribosomal protein L22 [Thermoplasmata archaeon]HIH97434.1 50S ribosomal protein L22 [Thermoplasmata archaeon]